MRPKRIFVISLFTESIQSQTKVQEVRDDCM